MNLFMQSQAKLDKWSKIDVRDTKYKAATDCKVVSSIELWAKE